MANILSLKRRINAAKNVSKTTKALQMISASKLKKAQNAVLATRPYVNKISEMAYTLKQGVHEGYTHPYLEQKNGENKTLLIALSPDKGLCGSLVTNLIREFASFQKQEPDTSYIVIGKKLEGRIIKLSKEIVASFAFGNTLPSFDMVYPLKKIIDDYYKTGKVNSVKVLTTEYTNVFVQTPKIITLLPITIETQEIEETTSRYSEYEPNEQVILNSLFEHYLEMAIYQQLVESFVSEHAARMSAMQNASDNANDIIDALQMEYNKTRQAKITSEILDIGGGSNVKNDSL